MCPLFLAQQPNAAQGPLILAFLDHTQWHITVGRTPLNEGSVRRRDLYLTTHNTHKRQISRSTAEFEPPIPTTARPQSFSLERSGPGIRLMNPLCLKTIECKVNQVEIKCRQSQSLWLAGRKMSEIHAGSYPLRDYFCVQNHTKRFEESNYSCFFHDFH